MSSSSDPQRPLLRDSTESQSTEAELQDQQQQEQHRQGPADQQPARQQQQQQGPQQQPPPPGRTLLKRTSRLAVSSTFQQDEQQQATPLLSDTDEPDQGYLLPPGPPSYHNTTTAVNNAASGDCAAPPQLLAPAPVLAPASSQAAAAAAAAAAVAAATSDGNSNGNGNGGGGGSGSSVVSPSRGAAGLAMGGSPMHSSRVSAEFQRASGPAQSSQISAEFQRTGGWLHQVQQQQQQQQQQFAPASSLPTPRGGGGGGGGRASTDGALRLDMAELYYSHHHQGSAVAGGGGSSGGPGAVPAGFRVAGLAGGQAGSSSALTMAAAGRGFDLIGASIGPAPNQRNRSSATGAGGGGAGGGDAGSEASGASGQKRRRWAGIRGAMDVAAFFRGNVVEEARSSRALRHVEARRQRNGGLGGAGSAASGSVASEAPLGGGGVAGAGVVGGGGGASFGGGSGPRISTGSGISGGGAAAVGVGGGSASGGGSGPPSRLATWIMRTSSAVYPLEDGSGAAATAAAAAAAACLPALNPVASAAAKRASDGSGVSGVSGSADAANAAAASVLHAVADAGAGISNSDAVGIAGGNHPSYIGPCAVADRSSPRSTDGTQAVGVRASLELLPPGLQVGVPLPTPGVAAAAAPLTQPQALSHAPSALVSEHSIASQLLTQMQRVPGMQLEAIWETRGDRQRRSTWIASIMGDSYESALLRQLSRGEGGKQLMFSPLSRFRLVWDGMLLLALLYYCVLVPLRIPFGQDSLNALLIADLALTGVFLADIAVNFNTGYDDSGTVVMDPRPARLRYLRTWFAADLLSAFPFEVIALLAPGIDGTEAIYLRLPRLLKLLRINFAFRYLQRWSDLLPVNSFQLRMIKLGFVIAVFVHANACLQLAIAYLQGPESATSWIHVTGIAALPEPQQYLHAVFRALSNTITIGYGLDAPRNTVDLATTFLSMACGALLWATLMGMVTSLLQRKDRSSAAYTQALQAAKEYCRTHSVPPDLRQRMIAGLRVKYPARKLMDEHGVLAEAHGSLRADLRCHAHRNLLARAPLLQACCPALQRALLGELRREVVPAGDVIYDVDDPSSFVYFISRGIVEILGGGAGAVLEHVTTLGAGAHFGEMSMLKGLTARHAGTAVAVTDCDLHLLPRRSFEALGGIYPELGDALRLVAAARGRINAQRAHNTATDGGGNEGSVGGDADGDGGRGGGGGGHGGPPMGGGAGVGGGSARTSGGVGVGTGADGRRRSSVLSDGMRKGRLSFLMPSASQQQQQQVPRWPAAVLSRRRHSSFSALPSGLSPGEGGGGMRGMDGMGSGRYGGEDGGVGSLGAGSGGGLAVHGEHSSGSKNSFASRRFSD